MAAERMREGVQHRRPGLQTITRNKAFGSNTGKRQSAPHSASHLTCLPQSSMRLTVACVPSQPHSCSHDNACCVLHARTTA